MRRYDNRLGFRDPDVAARRKKVAILMDEGLKGRAIERKLNMQPSVVYQDIRMINKARKEAKEGKKEGLDIPMFWGAPKAC